jgi:hypothetical protein
MWNQEMRVTGMPQRSGIFGVLTETTRCQTLKTTEIRKNVGTPMWNQKMHVKCMPFVVKGGAIVQTHHMCGA